MNQLKKWGSGRGLLFVIMAAGLPLGSAKAGILDSFDEYNSTTYIQGSNTLATAQQGTNGRFLRFGTAVSDGLYSSAAAGNGGGTGNRGAVANATFSTTTNPVQNQYGAQLNFTNSSGTATPFSLSTTGSCTITLDIKVASATLTPNLSTYIQVQDAAGQQYQAAAVAVGTTTTYTTFSFNFSSATVTNTVNVSASDSLANVLANTSIMNILFRDTVDTNTTSQAISFDNLTYTATTVPEPSTWVMGGLLTLGAAFSYVRRGQRQSGSVL